MPEFSLDATTPLGIKKENEREFIISWKDGHKSLYPFHYLRSACLCASCVDERTGIRVLDSSTIPQDIRPLAVTPVGRYGVQINWSDGHSTGIYAFDYLRSLCPCDHCQSAAE